MDRGRWTIDARWLAATWISADDEDTGRWRRLTRFHQITQIPADNVDIRWRGCQQMTKASGGCWCMLLTANGFFSRRLWRRIRFRTTNSYGFSYGFTWKLQDSLNLSGVPIRYLSIPVSVFVFCRLSLSGWILVPSLPCIIYRDFDFSTPDLRCKVHWRLSCVCVQSPPSPPIIPTK